MNCFKKLASIFFLVLFTLACQEKPKNKKEKDPNIMFLFADDYTYEAIHALGNNVIETPNLDRLVNQGTTFTHAYNMGGWNGAICVASRSMIISGKYLWNAHNTVPKWKEKDSLAMSNTWGQLMESEGYNTYMTGKWHVEAPAKEVFGTAKNIKPGMPNDMGDQNNSKEMFEAYKAGKEMRAKNTSAYYRPIDENDTLWNPASSKFKGFWEGGKHWSEVVRDDALEFLDDATQKENPFFMYLAFNAPHDPRQSPQEYLDKYNINDIVLPENWLPEYPYADGMNSGFHMRDERLAPYPRTPFAIKTHLKEYYAIITHLDEQIGKILDALEASGEMENTYIFFTGDHGLSVGHHGLLGKQSMYDHSIRVPLMIVGPDIPKGKRVATEVYLQDIMATSLALTKMEKPDHVEFNSLLPLAKGETTQGHLQDGVYGAFEKESQRMIRKDGYKLIVYPKIDKILMFNMKEDPMEIFDLAKDPKNIKKVKGLFSDLMSLQKKMNDPLDLNRLYNSL
ncbi:sulfatase-like hydrolase/transferase [Maribacter ulvicola]|uniref:Arylsulfatase A n=1 Tax=Maribacter ulvicola TaxID=228959 RepID=A0A1N6ZYR9_9FLAO|nr:sulfatase-like hydrolase/transferase [Maribacter ulvicola]SIR31903.1 Arylsulfatase A [Maribacter ulvicola]